MPSNGVGSHEQEYTHSLSTSISIMISSSISISTYKSFPKLKPDNPLLRVELLDLMEPHVEEKQIDKVKGLRWEAQNDQPLLS